MTYIAFSLGGLFDRERIDSGDIDMDFVFARVRSLGRDSLRTYNMIAIDVLHRMDESHGSNKKRHI